MLWRLFCNGNNLSWKKKYTDKLGFISRVCSRFMTPRSLLCVSITKNSPATIIFRKFYETETCSCLGWGTSAQPQKPAEWHSVFSMSPSDWRCLLFMYFFNLNLNSLFSFVSFHSSPPLQHIHPPNRNAACIGAPSMFGVDCTRRTVQTLCAITHSAEFWTFSHSHCTASWCKWTVQADLEAWPLYPDAARGWDQWATDSPVGVLWLAMTRSLQTGRKIAGLLHLWTLPIRN